MLPVVRRRALGASINSFGRDKGYSRLKIYKQQTAGNYIYTVATSYERRIMQQMIDFCPDSIVKVAIRTRLYCVTAWDRVLGYFRISILLLNIDTIHR